MRACVRWRALLCARAGLEAPTMRLSSAATSSSKSSSSSSPYCGSNWQTKRSSSSSLLLGSCLVSRKSGGEREGGRNKHKVGHRHQLLFKSLDVGGFTHVELRPFLPGTYRESRKNSDKICAPPERSVARSFRTQWKKDASSDLASVTNGTFASGATAVQTLSVSISDTLETVAVQYQHFRNFDMA